MVPIDGLAVIRTWLQGTLGLLTTIIVLVLCFAFFAVRIATRSHPEPYTSSHGNVSDTTRVYRNAFGVPHIVGATMLDAVFAQGYVHAQDRLWQMDMFRRVGRGRVAEVMGPKAVDADVLIRTLGVADIAHSQWVSLSSASRELLQSYANGVNAYIRDHRGGYSFEFDALDYEPELWTAEDCLVVSRALAFESSFSFWSDIAYAQIAAQRSARVARMYIPVGRTGEPMVLDSGAYYKPATTDTSGIAGIAADINTTSLARQLRSVRHFLQLEASGVGSNAWAVSKAPMKGGIVANDPHLPVTMPAKFYQVHLSTPTMNVMGMSIPGLPLVVSGRNDNVAWAVSNVMVDDVDFFLERVDSINSNYYMDAEVGRHKFRYRRDTIRIKGRSDTLFDIRYTRRSAVIGDAHVLRSPSELFGVPRIPATSLLSSTCITFRWTAQTTSDEPLALLRLASAASVADVQKAVSTWYAPAFHFTYATMAGHVGTVAAGIAPVRGNGDPQFLSSGWDEAADWRGTVLLSTLGMAADPRSGYVVAANNRASSRNAPYVGNLFEPSSRAERILGQLAIYDDYTARDAQVMQLDVVSPYAQRFMRLLMPVLKRGMARFDPLERRVLQMIATWDGSFTTRDSVAAVYAAFQQEMIRNTFEDELGQQLFMDWSYVGNIPMRRMMELLEDPTHVLFDDIRTPQKEDLTWIAIRSFIEAVQAMRQRFQSDLPAHWQYGKMHTITFGHRFGKHPLMGPVMNQGPFEMPGSGTTINSADWPIYNPYNVTVAAAMRVISDLGDSIQYSVVPGGVSGQPLDPHYADQMQLWLKGGYVRLPVSAEPDVTFRQFHVFLPTPRNGG